MPKYDFYDAKKKKKKKLPPDLGDIRHPLLQKKKVPRWKKLMGIGK